MTSQLSGHSFIAVSHSGTPVGHQEEIANVQTYVSEPTNPSESKGVVLYFSDVFWSLSSSISSFDTYLFLGFCFGAPHVFNLAKDGGLIVCGTHILVLCYVCVISYRHNRLPCHSLRESDGDR
jgi:hypothetical protein